MEATNNLPTSNTGKGRKTEVRLHLLKITIYKNKSIHIYLILPMQKQKKFTHNSKMINSPVPGCNISICKKCFLVCVFFYLFFFSPKKENISKRKIPTRRSDFIFFSSLSLAESNVAQVGISFYNSLMG